MSSPVTITLENVAPGVWLAAVEEPGDYFGVFLGNVGATARTSHGALVLLSEAVRMAEQVRLDRQNT